MPGNAPETAGFFARHRELPETAGAALSGPAFVTGRSARPQSRRPVVTQEDTDA